MVRTFRKTALVSMTVLLGPFALHVHGAESTDTPIPIALIDLDYEDTSGEPIDQTAAHEARVRLFMQTLRVDLNESGEFEVVSIACEPDPCSITDSDPETLVNAAKKADAKLLFFGGIHKMSTLIQFANVQVVDVEQNKLVMQRSLSFRGDDDRSWLRAEKFLVKQMSEELLK